MNYIQLTKANLEQEHICCAITEKKGETRVASKKAWLSERLDEGLVFLKADVRGKAFIEYIDAENAWCPLRADQYLYINCLWVSGQFKGQGISNDLLNACIMDAKKRGKHGICVLSSKKKLPFLSDPKYLRYKGFQVCDEAGSFELLYLPLQKDAVAPKFLNTAKQLQCEEDGLVLYYSAQCPHAVLYAEMAGQLAKSHGLAVHLHHLASAKEAQAVPCPPTTYALFLNHEFVTNEILSDKKLEKLVQDYVS